MTPIGLSLQHTLELERLRMANEWFFCWHGLKEQRGVDVDGFDGRRIQMAGIHFYGAPREVYWNALNRYISKQIEIWIKHLETETISYPYDIKMEAANDFRSLLEGFNAQIVEIAIAKDRVLGGDGINFPQRDECRGRSLIQLAAISERIDAFIRLETARIPRSTTPTNIEKTKKWTLEFGIELIKGFIKTQLRRWTGIDV